MALKVCARGHPAIWRNGVLCYADTGRPVGDEPPRPCVRCGRLPLPGGEDACRGEMPGIAAACCGHGVVSAFIVAVNGPTEDTPQTPQNDPASCGADFGYPCATALYRVGYHGTNAEAARSIMREGFRAGTYFAEHLDDALRFGGSCLFAVLFERSRFNPAADPADNWQWFSYEPIPADRILWAGILECGYRNRQVEGLLAQDAPLTDDTCGR